MEYKVWNNKRRNGNFNTSYAEVEVARDFTPDNGNNKLEASIRLEESKRPIEAIKGSQSYKEVVAKSTYEDEGKLFHSLKATKSRSCASMQVEAYEKDVRWLRECYVKET
ncbi:hypothetical protein Ancab_002574 [Ancistrocladus abbreviatus]